MPFGEMTVKVPNEQDLLEGFARLDSREHVMEDFFRHVAAALAGRGLKTAYVVNMLATQNVDALNRSDELDDVLARYEDFLEVLIPDPAAYDDAWRYWHRPVSLDS